MFGLTFAGLRERWPLFLGALLTVAIGVALVGSAVTLASSASPPDLSGFSFRDAAAIREAFDGVATVMILGALLSGLLTTFIVATTFAFTVAERRRDIALVRLLGAQRRQVRVVLMGEAIALGVVGAVLGIALTHPGVALQLWLLRRAEFVPDGFHVTTTWWPQLTAGGIGVMVAFVGVLAASRRAASVPPLEAIRGDSERIRVMTASRWIVGLAMLIVTAGQIVAGVFAGLVVAVALAIGVAVAGAIALSQLAPVVLPVGIGLLGLPIRATTLGTLAQANAREGVRRSASTAAPVIVLVALVVSLTSAFAAITTAIAIEERDHIRADLIVSTTGTDITAIAALPGVEAVSAESTPDLIVRLVMRDNGETTSEQFFDSFAVIDPIGYATIHEPDIVAGSLSDVTGSGIAVMERPTDGVTFHLGDQASVTYGATQLNVRITAILHERLSTDQQILLPRDMVPTDLLASAPTNVLVRMQDQSDVPRVRKAARAHGKVTSIDAWVAANARVRQRTNNATLVVLLALSGLYTGMAVINSIVIAGTGRRREHAIARLSGLTRSQVIATTAIEAVMTTITGLMLGLIVVASAILGIAFAARRSVGATVVEIPWTLLTSLTLGTIATTIAVSVAVTYVVTRSSPITLAAARE